MRHHPSDVRTAAAWLSVAMMLLLLVGIELRRRAYARDAEAHLWPRPDGTIPTPAAPRGARATSYGEVWDLVHEGQQAA